MTDMSRKSIDISSDVGESFGNYTFGNDEEIMKLISSANVACGFHAGDLCKPITAPTMPAVTKMIPIPTADEKGSPRRGTAAKAAVPGTAAVIIVVTMGPRAEMARVYASKPTMTTKNP